MAVTWGYGGGVWVGGDLLAHLQDKPCRGRLAHGPKRVVRHTGIRAQGLLCGLLDADGAILQESPAQILVGTEGGQEPSSPPGQKYVDRGKLGSVQANLRRAQDTRIKAP